jgi:3D (Asp-Asp-Asp) domain-containing protein
MSIGHRTLPRLLSCTLAGLLLVLVTALPAVGAGGSALSSSGRLAHASGGAGGSGGAVLSPGGLAPATTPRKKLPPAPSKHAAGRWLGGVSITEYWPAPESWFVGRLVSAPGLPGRHRIDWLYSATGISMQGDGIGLDGRRYHIDALGDGGWVTANGALTSPSASWSAGPPYWRAGAYWRNRRQGVTFPLQAGGWSNGVGRRYVPLPGIRFAAGPSLPLRYYQSIAVDPRVIPIGSRVYVPAYRDDGHGGWFIAQDTGGAINGHHIDVYRSPPASPSDSGQYLTGRRIFVIRPKH